MSDVTGLVRTTTGKIHRANLTEKITRCGLGVDPEWELVVFSMDDGPTCLHCLYPTRADLEAAKR